MPFMKKSVLGSPWFRTERSCLNDLGLLVCSKGEEKATGDGLGQLSKGGAVLMVCRSCGKKGDHWTSHVHRTYCHGSKDFWGILIWI
ncbi:hypothetical protein Lser_V15G18600 [Lactuca serriola]